MHEKVKQVLDEYEDYKQSVNLKFEPVTIHSTKIELLIRNINHYEKVLKDIAINCSDPTLLNDPFKE